MEEEDGTIYALEDEFDHREEQQDSIMSALDQAHLENSRLNIDFVNLQAAIKRAEEQLDDLRPRLSIVDYLRAQVYNKIAELQKAEAEKNAG